MRAFRSSSFRGNGIMHRTRGVTTDEGMNAGALRNRLAGMADEERARVSARYFKTGPGEYGEGDVFLGVSMPNLRSLAKDCEGADTYVIIGLLCSPVHEERMLALLVLVRRYASGGPEEKEAVFSLYLSHTRWINNWDLVDVSAPHIVGAHLLGRDRGILETLARSDGLWERRIAVLATFAFIRQADFDLTLKLARVLLHDPEDLMHKAVGWMLREVGKRDEPRLHAFLGEHGGDMPRTMLRYAIERFPEKTRKKYLAMGRTGARR
jgi:3-methyladenine DNA glycosylase AlkD